MCNRFTMHSIVLGLALGLVVMAGCSDDDSGRPDAAVFKDAGLDGGDSGRGVSVPIVDAGDRPRDAGMDGGKPSDAGSCTIDSGDPLRRFEQRCSGGRCPATLEDLQASFDEDAGDCERRYHTCCGIVTVIESCLTYGHGWTFDQGTDQLIGIAFFSDVSMPCQPASWSGTFVHNCDEAHALGLCGGPDGG